MIEIKNNNFNLEGGKGLVLVDFYANWCGPCRMISPILHELEEKYKGKVKVIKVNIDENPQLASDYSVMSIPNLILFKDGEVLSHKIGFNPQTVLEQWITENL